MKSGLRKIVKTLRQKVKKLQQTVRRKNKKIYIQLIPIMKKNFTSKSLKKIIINGELIPKGKRYCKETKNLEPHYFFYPSKAYNYVQ